MKKMVFYAGALLLLAVSCQQKEGKTEASAAAAPPDMPYQLEKPWMNWSVGDPQNAVVVMKMVKAWEAKNTGECSSYFGDSCVMVFDGWVAKLGQDSIHTFISSSFANYDKIHVTMQDWESVISADKKEEWVTLWYKQVWTDKKGVTDSLSVSDEARVENGKIKTFVEYSLHFPKKKEDKKM